MKINFVYNLIFVFIIIFLRFSTGWAIGKRNKMHGIPLSLYWNMSNKTHRPCLINQIHNSKIKVLQLGLSDCYSIIYWSTRVVQNGVYWVSKNVCIYWARLATRDEFQPMKTPDSNLKLDNNSLPIGTTRLLSRIAFTL